MLANVNEQLWIDFGLDIAIFLDTIAFWLKKNAANKQYRNFQDDRYWTYNSQKAFQDIFPGWSRETIRRVIRNSVKNGLLLINNFNMHKYDRTSWFSLTDKALEYYPGVKLIIYNNPDNPGGDSLVGRNPSIGGTQPTYTKTTTISSINTTSDNASISANEVNAIVDAYHEELPDCPKIKVVDKQLRSQLKSMVKGWPRYQKDGKTFSIESFRDYLRYLKQHYSWLIGAYTTESGNKRKNGLRTITREVNIVKVVNGEFSAS